MVAILPVITTELLPCARSRPACLGYSCEKVHRILAFGLLPVSCGETVNEHIRTKLMFGTDEG